MHRPPGHRPRRPVRPDWKGFQSTDAGSEWRRTSPARRESRPLPSCRLAIGIDDVSLHCPLLQLDLQFAGSGRRKPSSARAERNRHEVEEIFDEYLKWIEDTMTTEPRPWIKVVCAMTGENRFGRCRSLTSTTRQG